MFVVQELPALLHSGTVDALHCARKHPSYLAYDSAVVGSVMGALAAALQLSPVQAAMLARVRRRRTVAAALDWLICQKEKRALFRRCWWCGVGWGGGRTGVGCLNHERHCICINV